MDFKKKGFNRSTKVVCIGLKSSLLGIKNDINLKYRLYSQGKS